jgi:hypothetical protein
MDITLSSSLTIKGIKHYVKRKVCYRGNPVIDSFDYWSATKDMTTVEELVNYLSDNDVNLILE